MFSKSQTPNEPRQEAANRPPSSSDAPPSIISVDMKIVGNLVTDGDVQIDGTIEGDVRSHSLSVGRTAQISGELVADVVRIWGRVEGRVCGREVSLMETAEVNGDILHETLEVARGAVVDGSVKRQKGDALLSTPKLQVTHRKPAETAAPEPTSPGESETPAVAAAGNA
ncbi:MAG: polymer-forming cytoskeletal protein [Rhodospirillaceae bacterium]|nr:polymer-forming cytoskeletal protein [Rhodospirillaceae bacterium]MCA8933957.1 polymer-forming cytoskeletal protein [Rhodospirillaceae bacterium]